MSPHVRDYPCTWTSVPRRDRRIWGSNGSVLRALDIGAVGGHHNHAGADADVLRHRGANAVGELRRLERAGRGLALHRRLGIDDLEDDFLWELDRHRLAL